MKFQIWHAALIVLVEDRVTEYRHYNDIAAQIRARALYHTNGNTFAQTVGYAIRVQGRRYIVAVGGGNYQLKDRGAAEEMYGLLKEWFPRKPFKQDAIIVAEAPAVGCSISSTGESSANDRLNSPRRNAKRQKPKLHDVSDLQTPVIAEQVPDSYEGKPLRITINSYVRDPTARARCIAAHAFRCAVCNMSFAEESGEIGENYIHVHHKNPFGKDGSSAESVGDFWVG